MFKSNSVTVFLLWSLPCYPLGYSFLISQTSSSFSRVKLMMGTEDEPDLFDFFDPLLSPHAYPDGISPKNPPKEPSKKQAPAKSSSSFGIDYNSSKSLAKEEVEETNQDLFDYFDPLLSPHAYPNGISPQGKPQPLEVESTVSQESSTASSTDDRYNPLTFPNFADSQKEAAAAASNRSTSKVGILLMDHGSRNAASNSRLKQLAELYQMTMEGENIVVQAAHMEIASPSIPEGLEQLLQAGVDEIVCHPYFLSPGRHVREDIPQIIEGAIASLNIQIPLTVTDPVGTNTQLMLGAIHSLVRENSKLMREKK